MIEQFSVQFRKTKTTVLTKANWSAGRHQSQPVGIQVKNRQISFESDWMRRWRDFLGPITVRNWAKAKQSWITFDTQLKTALCPWWHLTHSTASQPGETDEMYFQILLCTSSERRLSLLTLPLIASLRLPPEPHKATNRILSSTQTRTPSLHCCWLFLPRMRVSAADYTSWHSWLAWAYGSDSALTDLERKPQGLDEISRWSKIRVDLHYLVFKFNCFVQCQLFIMFRFPWKYVISRWNNTTNS